MMFAKGGLFDFEEKCPTGTKGDMYAKEIITEILEDGCLDQNPRPHYEDVYEGVFDNFYRFIKTNDGDFINIEDNQRVIAEKISGKSYQKLTVHTPAHTLSINHKMCTYNLNKGEFPIWTLRPIAVKSAIGELLWIYQDTSNDLNVLREKYKVNWWDEWNIGDDTIGCVYGETVRRHNSMKRLLEELKSNPDGRRHIIDLWQEDDFKNPHGLKPCAFLTVWNVRHGRDGVDYLDMCLIQRSSDFLAAGAINQVQYVVLQYLVARHCGFEVGKFSWVPINVQIYDRHIEQAKELLNREPIDCQVSVWLNPEKTNFYDFTVDDIKIIGYPLAKIKEKNPQVKLPIGI